MHCIYMISREPQHNPSEAMSLPIVALLLALLLALLPALLLGQQYDTLLCRQSVVL